MDWTAAYEILQKYAFKIETPLGFGTGFHFAFNADKKGVAIATALHVVEHANEWRQPIKLTQELTGKIIHLEATERAILIDRDRDSAAIVFDATALSQFEAPLELAPEKSRLKIGFEGGWFGYPALAPQNLCFF